MSFSRDYPRHRLSRSSRSRMRGVHPDLIEVVYRASEILRDMEPGNIDFKVGEGLRTPERQEELLRKGASTTSNSRHLLKRARVRGQYKDVGHAVDLLALVDNKYRPNWAPYYVIADAMKQAAVELSIDITWGGDWKGFPDGAHYQLSWDSYPIWRPTKTKHI